MPHPVRATRRSFLKASAVSAFTFNLVPRHVLCGPEHTPPSARVTLAGIGIGGVGHSQLKSCDKAGFQIVALCDVDDLHAKKTYDAFPQARRYRDFRELLGSEGDKVDAVYCGTPDHTHAVIALAALRAKKHLCCVKPLTRTVEECRAVVDAARRAGVATQVTTRPNTGEEGCRTTELIEAGAIGPVREVHVWSYRPVWPQGMPGRPEGEDPVPGTLDWRLWIGPAPMRPFKDAWPAGHPIPEMPPKNWGGRKVYHPFNFRGWWDFGTGALGDMGCHYMNTPYRALKLGYPSRVSASTSRRSDEAFPLASIVTYDYPAREGLPPVRVVWYDGGLQPPKPAELGVTPLPDEGVLYIGDKGKMVFEKILDPSLAEACASIPKSLPRREGTWGEWHAACKGGGREGGVPDRYDTWQQSAETDEANSSFLYELSGAAATWDWKSYLAGKPAPTALDTDKNGEVSWQEAKLWQLAHGDAAQTNAPAAYAAHRFPVVRCYWHAYPGSKDDLTQRSVISLAADLDTVFLSQPWWEKDLTPVTLR